MILETPSKSHLPSSARLKKNTQLPTNTFIWRPSALCSTPRTGSAQCFLAAITHATCSISFRKPTEGSIAITQRVRQEAQIHTNSGIKHKSRDKPVLNLFISFMSVKRKCTENTSYLTGQAVLISQPRIHSINCATPQLGIDPRILSDVSITRLNQPILDSLPFVCIRVHSWLTPSEFGFLSDLGASVFGFLPFRAHQCPSVVLLFFSGGGLTTDGHRFHGCGKRQRRVVAGSAALRSHTPFMVRCSSHRAEALMFCHN